MHNSPEQLKTLKHVKLDPDRKAAMRAKLSEYADLKPLPQAAQSTAPAGSLWWFSPAPVLALIVLMFVGTGSFGVLAAAKQSLPGDQLYAVKTNLYEPFQRWLADTPAEIAAVALEQSEERNREIAALDNAGALSSNVKETLERRRDRALKRAERQSTVIARTDPTAAESIARQIAVLAPADPEPTEPEPTVVAVTPTPMISADTRPQPTTTSDTPTTPEPKPTVTAAEPAKPTITLTQVHERIRETLNDTLESLASLQTRLQEMHLGQNDSNTGGTTSTIKRKIDVAENTDEADSKPSRSGGGSSNSNDGDDDTDSAAATPETNNPTDETTDPDDDTDVASSTDETTEPAPSSDAGDTGSNETEPEPPSTTVDRPLPIATSTVQ